MAYVFDVKVVPQSGKQRCQLDKGGALKCYLRSAPEGGKANDELCTFLGKSLKVPKKAVSIVLGETARKKRIKIEGTVDQHKLYNALGIDIQLKI